MRLKALRPTALTLVMLIAVCGPARAGTITLAELPADGSVRQFRSASELRLRVAPQSNGAAVAQAAQGPQAGGQAAAGQSAQQPNGTAAPAGTGNVTTIGADATLSQSGGQVETVDLGDVTGTVCDCGEIPQSIIPRAAAFPWWTLAGIPLICVSGICFGDEDTPPTNPPPPTPPPPNNPIPEPATLLLFGTGLLAAGAGARRRGRRQAATETTTAEEV
jgi:hypothetical protein